MTRKSFLIAATGRGQRYTHSAFPRRILSSLELALFSLAAFERTLRAGEIAKAATPEPI
jgi:hypothetical protein